MDRRESKINLSVQELIEYSEFLIEITEEAYRLQSELEKAIDMFFREGKTADTRLKIILSIILRDSSDVFRPRDIKQEYTMDPTILSRILKELCMTGTLKRSTEKELMPWGRPAIDEPTKRPGRPSKYEVREKVEDFRELLYLILGKGLDEIIKSKKEATITYTVCKVMVEKGIIKQLLKAMISVMPHLLKSIRDAPEERLEKMFSFAIRLKGYDYDKVDVYELVKQVRRIYSPLSDKDIENISNEIERCFEETYRREIEPELMRELEHLARRAGILEDIR